ncbi:unnamed protein product [Psylliodes chrysocephalus]|uniref:Uncharacterized protein n=1 Tax=Psylliodes chrysocephalus TaxID=3402493 RepID=A0A9P0D2M5_9CUCU|nr:unnamed protein product [Psylliodes chrysocephala]
MLLCSESFFLFMFTNAVIILAQEFRLDSYIVDRPLPYLSKHSFINRSEQNITIKNCSLETIAPEAFKNVKAAKIYIIENPLRILRRRMFNLVMVDELYCDRNQISEIEPGTFHYVHPIYEDALQILSLSNNKLHTIKRGVFSGTNFRKILLNSNKIDYIEFGSFENMPYLLALHLGDNMLQRIDIGIFNGFPNPMLLRLSGNKINFIHRRAFENSTFLSLDLQDNDLGNVEKEYFINALIGWYFI